MLLREATNIAPNCMSVLEEGDTPLDNGQSSMVVCQKP